MTFFGLPDLTASACASEVAEPEAGAAAVRAPDAAASEPAIAPVADVPFDPPIAPAVALPFDPPFATEAARAAATSEAVTTCSIDPSTTTRDPSIPAPVWPIFNVSDEVSANLLRISCSHASEFL